MTTVKVPWEELEPMLYERMERTINADPNVLLETDGGPVGKTADIILARLYERDDQAVRDLRLTRVEPVILIAIPERLTMAEPTTPESFEMPRTARFVLQSGFATCQLSPEYAPPFVTPKPPDFMTSVLFVRYRRRG